MASVSQKIPVRPSPSFTTRNGLLDRYFYLFMSLLVAAIVVLGFSRSVGEHLFHPPTPRPQILWFHGGAFSMWVLFFILQSTLVRVRKVSWHRFLGWIGAGLAAVMVVLGVTTAIIMGRFDSVQLRIPDAEAFLIVPFYDMIVFPILIGMAIYWRKKPEMHRRLMLIATCGLLDAAWGRFDYIAEHGYFFWFADSVMLLGVLRDLAVDRRIHRVYLVALPLIVVCQAIAIHAWRSGSPWWVRIAHSILG
jgi:hypothetical protein